MIELKNDPKTSWRNHQRVRFIKGFYKKRHLLDDMIDLYDDTGSVPHEMIDTIMETNLRELKDLSHILYRPQDEQLVDQNRQRIFDKILGTLWHELGKARDNIRLIEAYSNQYELDDNGFKKISRLDTQILKAARKDLPRQLHRAKKLMGELVPLFEKILPLYKNNDIILRTLYFSRGELDQVCKPSTVEYFFPIIHGNVAVGYFVLIRSLLQTKHTDEAKKVLAEMESFIASDQSSRMILEEAKLEFKKY